MELLGRKLWLSQWAPFGKACIPNTDGLAAGSASYGEKLVTA
jgi:hypothetical protein